MNIDYSTYPNVRSFKRKFGLLIPATNTSMEHELWSLIFKNQDVLAGVGLHTSNVITPSPKLATPEDLIAYGNQFLTGLKSALETALLAKPDYLIMGMSLEHIIYGLDAIRAPMREVDMISGLGCATWHDAAPLALKKFNAKRIGIISPFDEQGNKNAAKMFTDLGFDVIATYGFSCQNAVEIAHVPDALKERAIIEELATPDNNLDAIVQCGTNMSMLQVTEKLEPILDMPILGINAVTFWHALQVNGFTAPMAGGGRLYL